MSQNILRSIAALLASGTPIAIANAHQLAKVQAFIFKLPVDQIIEMAKALIAG